MLHNGYIGRKRSAAERDYMTVMTRHKDQEQSGRSCLSWCRHGLHIDHHLQTCCMGLTFLRLALIMRVLGLSCFLLLLASAPAICRLSKLRSSDPWELVCSGLHTDVARYVAVQGLQCDVLHCHQPKMVLVHLWSSLKAVCLDLHAEFAQHVAKWYRLDAL